MLFQPNPVAFTFLGQDIRWYGICIATGILVAVIIAYLRAPSHKIKSDRVIDLVLVSLPMGIVGARLYYVAFNWDYYQGDFFKIINLRSGGLAIHGGLILGLLTAAFFCRLWQIDALNLLDLMAPSIAIAQSIGRWGNFFNQEAYGTPTDLPWAILINGEKVHPTFLYESIWCFLLFFVLIYIDKRREYYGKTFFFYGMLYSLERFFVEQLRTDSLMLGSLRVAQLVSGLVFLAFAFLILNRYFRHKRKSRIFY